MIHHEVLGEQRELDTKADEARDLCGATAHVRFQQARSLSRLSQAVRERECIEQSFDPPRAPDVRGHEDRDHQFEVVKLAPQTGPAIYELYRKPGHAVLKQRGHRHLVLEHFVEVCAPFAVVRIDRVARCCLLQRCRQRLFEHLAVGSDDEHASGDTEECAHRVERRDDVRRRAPIKFIHEDNDLLAGLLDQAPEQLLELLVAVGLVNPSIHVQGLAAKCNERSKQSCWRKRCGEEHLGDLAKVVAGVALLQPRN